MAPELSWGWRLLAVPATATVKVVWQAVQEARRSWRSATPDGAGDMATAAG
ncbi:hypothetical protein ACFL6X_04155 [Candidatus Latescibacterota bacterium]